MRTKWLAVLALVAALGLFTPAAFADHDKDKDKGNPHERKNFDDERGWERHDNYEVRIYRGHDDRPPGWSRGKKTGWGDCGLPPGQAKKYGCRTYVYQNRRYYYYEEEDGRVIVRRPRIEIHAVFP